MPDLSFFTRVLILVAFPGLASGAERWARGAGAVRWRGSAVILTSGTAGALFGPLVDWMTCWVSPEHFALGKGLAWSDDLRRRAYRLGLHAGASAGVPIGCWSAYCA